MNLAETGNKSLKASRYSISSLIFNQRVKCVNSPLTAASVRYRRSLELFQKVFLKTRVIAWDESAFYLEQQFMGEDGFVYAVALTKNTVIQGNKRDRLVSPAELVQQLTGWNAPSPSIPHNLQLWIQYNSASSAMLKNAL